MTSSKSPLHSCTPGWRHVTWVAISRQAAFLGCLAAGLVMAGDMPAYGPWHSSRFGGGGYALQVVVSQSNPARVYTNIDVGGLYRSDDSGRSWRMLHGNLPAHRSNYSVRDIWVDPTDSDCLLIATGDRWAGRQGIYRSSDGGGTWTKTYSAWFWGNGSRRAAGNVLLGDPVDPNRVYLAAIDDGFAISTDKGKSWLDTGQLKHLYPTAIWIDPVNPQHIWVACHDLTVEFDGTKTRFRQGLYFSANHGQTFVLVNDGDFSEVIQLPWGDRPLIGLAGQTHVLASHDLGKTWHPQEDGLPIDVTAAVQSLTTSRSAFNSVAVGPDFVLVGTRHGEIYRLNNGQTEWSHVNPHKIREGDWWGRMEPGKWQHYGKAMSSITISPSDPSHWYTTDWYAIYQSTDAGRSWDISVNGLEASVILTIAADPFRPDLIHLGMADNGYVRSEDRGVSFKKPGSGPSNIKQIAASTVTAGLLYLVGPKGHDWLANQLYCSTDGGRSWSPCAMQGLPDMARHRCSSIALDPVDSRRLWIAVSGEIAPGQGGVYHSNDGGRSFLWDSQGMTGHSFFADSLWQAGPELAVVGDGGMVAISASNLAVYVRPDKAADWQRVALDLPSYGRPSSVAASSIDSGLIVIAIRGVGVLRSRDRGQTFEKAWDGDASYVALDPVSPNRITVASNQGVFFSSDYGDHFELLDQSLPDRVSRLPLAFAGERLIIGTAGSGIFFVDLPREHKPPHQTEAD